MVRLFLFLFVMLLYTPVLVAQEGIIQENEDGFCSVDGFIDSNVEGYTGDGYANVDNYLGAGILWSVDAPEEGIYSVTWRYANGGGSGDRLGVVWVNDSIPTDTISYTHTGSWRDWVYSDTLHLPLQQGVNRVRVVAFEAGGLPNVDYIKFPDGGITPTVCQPTYSLEVGQNFPEGGSVVFSPSRWYYDHGDQITLTAQPAEGYFFHSWSGSVPSSQSEHTFSISQNSTLTAMFYPNGTTMDSDAVGYATVQDDAGTPFMLIGGALGDTVLAQSKSDLEQYLDSDDHLVVTVASRIVGDGQVKIRSNKTLLGITDDAHIDGIGLQTPSSQNVIIRNMKLSHVVGGDELEITHDSRNIWIDRCELFTDRNHHKDYYDGLIDIKNGASFITVSRSILRDHFKAMLISSGDQQELDTVVRITYHHNLFSNLESRVPSIRFGKAHIFNNYYRNCGDAINSRMGACVRVEKNNFHSVGKAVHSDYSPYGGYVHLIDNVFGTSSFIDEPICELPIPYPYEHILDEPGMLPEIIAGDDPDPSTQPNAVGYMYAYPNPSSAEVSLAFYLTADSPIAYQLYDITGRLIEQGQPLLYPAGSNKIHLNKTNLTPGQYVVRIIAKDGVYSERIMITPQ